MRIKRTYVWLLLLSLPALAFDQGGFNQYALDLCYKSEFSNGMSKVQSFCVSRAEDLQVNCLQQYPKTGTQPITDNEPYCSPLFSPTEKRWFLVSGGDLRSYSAKTIVNHLIFSTLWDMIYFYADVKSFRQQNTFLKAQWLKVQLLREMLRDPSIPEGSWIIWVDDDLVLSDSRRYGMSMLELYIKKYGSASSMIITTDTHPWPGDYDWEFNTGVVMVKKNAISRHILSLWWSKRPASAEDQERYIPPNQYGLKLLLWENDFIGKGDLTVAPQRSDWGNLNTFHIFDEWEDDSEDGLAERGDMAIQHPGLDLDRKHELVLQTLKVASGFSISLGNLLIKGSCYPEKLTEISVAQLEDFVRDCLKF